MPAPLTERQALMVLNALPGIGPVGLNRLLSHFGGDPVAVLAADARRLARVEGIRPAASRAIGRWPAHFDLAKEEKALALGGTDFIIRKDGSYPGLLGEIPDPPIGLYRRGGYGIKDPCIALVGSRRTTLYGLGIARRLGAELAGLGFCVVSGLARGIDTAAHEGALACGGRTVAVLGTGIDTVYPPENRHLCMRIAESGAVLSEFPLGRRAERWSFPMRNRIVSGLCETAVVVESDIDGGAMITARFAGEQGRTVFAVPGRIDQRTSAGCHQLIRDGAALLTGVDDILSELGHFRGIRPAKPPGKEGRARGPAETPTLTGDERSVLACLGDGAVLAPDAIAARSGLGPDRIAAALTMLELKRLVARRLEGGYEAAVR